MKEYLFETDDLNKKYRMPESSILKKEIEIKNKHKQKIEKRLKLNGSDQLGIVITDDDLDGIGTATLISFLYDKQEIIHAGPSSPLSVSEAVELVDENLHIKYDVWITDIRLSGKDISTTIETVENSGASEIYLIDHHEWAEEDKNKIENTLTDVLIDTDQSSSELTYSYIVENFNGKILPDRLKDGVKTIGVYDCWRKNDEGDFIDKNAEKLAETFEVLDISKFMKLFKEKGVELTSETYIQKKIEQHRSEVSSLNNKALENARFFVFNPEKEKSVQVLNSNIHKLSEEGVKENEIVCALSYGNCNINDVSDELRERGADICAILTPNLKIGLRSSENFKHSHSIAALFGGGGHKQAAGGRIDEGDMGLEFCSILDYINYWENDGIKGKRKILKAFEKVALNNYKNNKNI